MFRPASRAVLRASVPRSSPITSSAAPARRFLSTAPPTKKRRSFKSLVARVTLAGAIVYYYNTSTVFAEEPARLARRIHPFETVPASDIEAQPAPTIESLVEEKRKKKAAAAPRSKQATIAAPEAEQAGAAPGEQQEGGLGGLQEEADQQGAFNPETGEINWDCPCLGGMAHGPCGEQFKAAFSCFVYSTEEPKGMDCIEKFKHMQDCFRQYPDIYGAELEDDENDVTADGSKPTAAPESAAPAPEAASSSKPAQTPSTADIKSPHERAEKVADSKIDDQPHPDAPGRQARAQQATEQVKKDTAEEVAEDDEPIPRQWYSGNAVTKK